MLKKEGVQWLWVIYNFTAVTINSLHPPGWPDKMLGQVFQDIALPEQVSNTSLQIKCVKYEGEAFAILNT